MDVPIVGGTPLDGANVEKALKSGLEEDRASAPPRPHGIRYCFRVPTCSSRGNRMP
jgi:hypothetical protein